MLAFATGRVLVQVLRVTLLICAGPALAGEIDTPAAPSLLTRSGIDAFALYEIGNVRGLDASRVVGNYRWNGLPVLNQVREATESAERYDLQTGSRALETGFVYPGGVVDLVSNDPRAPTARLAGGLSTGTLRYAAVDLGGGGLRLNLAAEDGGLAVPGLRYSRSFAAAGTSLRISADTEVVASIELEKFKDRGEQAAISLDGLGVPTAPPARTLLGQPWAGAHGTHRIASLRMKQRLGEDWEAFVGALRLDSQLDDHEFAGRLLPGNRYELLYGHDPGQRPVSDTVHAELRGKAHLGKVIHRLTFGATAMRYRSKIRGAASTVLGTASLDEPREFQPVVLDPTGPAFEAQRASDTGWSLSDSAAISERLTLLAAVKVGRYRQSGANVVEPADEGYRLKSFGATYRFGATAAVYASYGEALEQGSTVPLGAPNAERVLPSNVTRQVETGVRFAAAAGLEVEAALFRAKKGYAYPTLTGDFVQDGQLVHDGIELKAVGEPVRNLRVFSALLFLRPQVEDALDPTVNARPAINVPRRRLKLVIEQIVTSVPGLSLNAALDSFSRRAADAYGTAYVPGYSVLGLGAQLDRKWLGERTTLTFGIDNIADRAYWASAADGRLSLGDPRSAYLRLEVAWQ
jgi:iron complex outermembrane receptor protein